MAEQPQGWTPVSAAPEGWTPVEPSRAEDKTKNESSYVALLLKAIEQAKNPALNVATSPNVPRNTAQVARAVGGFAPIVANPTNPMSYIAAPGAAWAAGKGGWFGGKILQGAAANVARALESAGPALNIASGAQGVLDLAQMADPKRKDIGTFGIGIENRSDAEKAANPAMINALVAYLQNEIAKRKGK